MTMKPCPEQRANCFSKFFFFWITRLIIDGFRRPLVFDDLWNLMPTDTCSTIIPKFERKWKQQIVKSGWRMVHKDGEEQINGKLDEVTYENAVGDGKKVNKDKPKEEYVSLETGKKVKEPSFTKALIGTFGLYFGMGGLLKILHDVISFANPQILGLLITFISTRDPVAWHGFLYAGLMFFFALLRSLINQHYWHICYRTGMNVRSAVIGSVYRKAMRLNNSSRKNATVGEIVNLMSVDAQKLQDCTRFVHMMWSSPLILCVALYFLWQLMGPAVLSGLAVLVLLIPLNAVLAQKNRILQMKQMRQKDKRIKLTNEVLSGIKVLKLYAWEDSFRDQLTDIREGELRNLRTMAFLHAGTSLSFMLAPYLVALATFATYVLSSPDNILDANRAFVSLSLFNLMNYPMSILPGVIAQIVQANISIKRITKFLLNDELDPENIGCDEQEEAVIKVTKADFSWSNGSDIILKDINFSVKEGSLVGVVGVVGSGKSSLISAMLGEMEVLRGKTHVKGKVSYVPQQAWIQNATVRGNILFGKEFSCEKYTNCIDACALEADYKIMPAGDETEIGEKGINLSGGQKQRISLARAVYQNNDIYLLDDPLSAVDSHVGKHIFDNVIGSQGLLRNKTRILVTNGLTFLPKVDFVIVLKDGAISEMGSYEELLSHNGAFAEFIATYLQEHQEEETDDPELLEIRAQLARQISALSQSTLNSIGCEDPASPSKSVCSPKDKMAGNCAPANEVAVCKIPGAKKKQGGKLVEEESAETGAVKFSVMWMFMRACGLIPFFLVVMFYSCFLVSGVATNIWLSDWANDATRNDTGNSTDLRDKRLAVYGGLGAIQALVVLCQTFAIAVGMISASRVLHQRLVTNIVRAPMMFFDTTPLGRIINRFSKDIDVLDLNIPMTFRIWLGTLAGVLTTIVVISYSTPIFLTVVLPLGVMYYLIQRMYVKTARQLKRIDSVRRSPIFTHFSESISGASSIRAYGLTEDFTDISDQLVDENNMVMYPAMIANRWLGLYLECIGNMVVLFAALFVVIQRNTISAGLAGLSVAYSLQITISLNIMVQMTSDLESYIVAIERIAEYADTPSEAPAVVEDQRPPSSWPEKGQVVVQNYSTRYREGLDLVLRDISCTINPGEKVGIVGRTGAGKSSLTLALFRLIEAVSGKVFIDDIDVTPVGLKDLRSKITIIPQDPVVFSGTLRMNLDPFEAHTDQEVWASLENAHLKEFVSNLEEGLEFQCSEGGENLSVGQRQLLCLARALLRKTKILVLDEATAAVDLATDDLIQNTIRTEFEDSTVITIAHRLNTIMDYDRIMVLDKGKIAELDPPTTLLQDNNSIFYSMAKDAGLVRDHVVGEGEEETDAVRALEDDIGPAGTKDDDDNSSESKAEGP